VKTLGKSAQNPNNIRVRFREVPQVTEDVYTRVGYLPERTGTPDAYITTITSKVLQCKIYAVIPEQIRFLVNSSWEPFPGLGMFSDLVELIPQALFGVTLVQPWMKRRMWRGSTPVQMQVQMKFVAYDNTMNNVVTPCMYLQQMALPHESFSLDYVENEGTKNESSERLFTAYSPPGPSPFTVFDNMGGGDKIDITFGSFLQFESVIISESEVIFDSRFTPSGFPISAMANITFETFEMMTKEKLRAAYEFNASIPRLDEGQLQSITLNQLGKGLGDTVQDRVSKVSSFAKKFLPG